MTELPAIPQIDTPGELRLSLRETAWPRPTFGAAPGYLQCNLLIVPHGLAHDFSSFCAANAQACPLIYQTSPGQWDIPELGADIDLRTDLGSYRVFRDGQAVADLLDLHGTWQGDFVTFVLGSSFGLEAVFAAAGIEMPYLTRGETPAHYITGRDSHSSGTFRGPAAVTMRSLTAADAERVAALCEAYPHLHGAPLAIGDPDALGIEALEAPVADIGNPATVQDGEVPVFWASALTAQLALSAARLPFCIANTPGHLLVTDLEIEALRQDADAAPAAVALDAVAPVETAAETAVAETEPEAGDHRYASAIRPAHAPTPAGADAGMGMEAAPGSDERPLPLDEGDDTEGFDADGLHAIDEDEADAIAADAADGDADRDPAPEEDTDGADVPPFADELPPTAAEEAADALADDEEEAPFPAAEADENTGPGLAARGPETGETRADDGPATDRAEPAEPADSRVHEAPNLPPPMEWRHPTMSAGKLIRQRLAAASQPNTGKRESIFW